MDQQKLRALVFEKTGVKIDVDDPVFALVALNEAVLEEAVQRHVALIDAASLELAQQARLAGGLPPVHEGHSQGHPPGYVPTPAAGPVRPIATQSAPVTPRELRLLGAAACIAIATALIVLGGQAAFHQSGLSAEQAQALQKAERIERALQQLDPKLRAQLPADLQK
ncbi:hypothetical protein [Duganella radicis]|uniref:Uncharacterized protein n=1 Tax=Duganella radicis TaxID=551988 RepID=A0A6L6PFF0_9BURK|nr:hypothetical protein [Duganella radicis]MTV37419.1 hypothetical protein [Duganella radicis]